MFQCPVCGQLLEALTNVHCMTCHQTTKQELIQRYGPPKYVTPVMSREVQRWIREVQVLKSSDFDTPQLAARHTARDRR
jgi:hypothetical protein